MASKRLKKKKQAAAVLRAAAGTGKRTGNKGNGTERAGDRERRSGYLLPDGC